MFLNLKGGRLNVKFNFRVGRFYSVFLSDHGKVSKSGLSKYAASPLKPKKSNSSEGEKYEAKNVGKGSSVWSLANAKTLKFDKKITTKMNH